MTYKIKKRRRFFPGRVLFILFIIIIAGAIGLYIAKTTYDKDLTAVSNSQTASLFVVKQGASVKQIAGNLKSQGLIRSSWAFQIYVSNLKNASDLEAGTYSLSPSETTQEIVSTLSHGKVNQSLVTIIPGTRIDQVKSALINDGFTPVSVSNALITSNYANDSVLDFKPANINTLEGLLWPDSFEKQAGTSPETIINESLKEMADHLTPSVQQQFAAEGLSTYQGLILSSIILKEVTKPTDQVQVAQVFLTRLKMGMPLGSDAATDYGDILNGSPFSETVNTPYNLYINKGLPPTPISSINADALYAATHPSNTNWLYFVTGDNGDTYFSSTLAEQQANTAQYCHKLCSNN